MKIYVDKKPESCGVCTLVNVSVLDVMENREMVLQHICPIMDLSVNPDNLDANCPLIELKAKELEWKYDGEKWSAIMFVDSYISFYNFMSGTSVIDVNDSCIQKHNDKTNGELKQLCQNHYNKLFLEMVGGEK